MTLIDCMRNVSTRSQRKPHVLSESDLVLSSCGQTTLRKTLDLFRGRHIVQESRRVLAGCDYESWLSDAVSTQMRIYELDFCYEQQAKLDPNLEGPMWHMLAQHLSNTPCNEHELLWANLDDLKRYAQIESRIHAFDPIDEQELDAIVRLKCADVRIARASAWLYAGRGLERPLVRYWETYDEAWELIEDLVDIDEDGFDWNFNFWLYPFMASLAWRPEGTGPATLLARRLRALEDAYAEIEGPARTTLHDSFDRTLRAGSWALANQWRPNAAEVAGRMVTYNSLAATGPDYSGGVRWTLPKPASVEVLGDGR